MRELPRTTQRLRALGFDETMLVLTRANFSELEKLLPQAGGGFDLGAADDKTRLGDVDVGSEEGEVSCGEGGRKEDGEEKEGVARKPRKEATQEARGA